MKYLICFLISAGFALAQQATIRVVVTNDAGKVTSDVTIPTTDEMLNLVNDHRQTLIKTPAVAEVRDAQGNVVTPAVDAVLVYPTRAAYWRMVIRNTLVSIAGDKTKAVLAKKKLAEKAQADVDAEKEKVAQ